MLVTGDDEVNRCRNAHGTGIYVFSLRMCILHFYSDIFCSNMAYIVSENLHDY